MQLSAEAKARLKQAREATGLTQGQAAEAIGKARISVARWEGGARFPGEDDIQRLAELYQVEVPWILEGQGEPPTPTLTRMREATFAYKAMQPVTKVRRNRFPRRAHPESSESEKQAAAGMKEITSDQASDFLDAVASRLKHLLAIQSHPLEVQGVPQELIQAIAAGTVIPTRPLLSAICLGLGVNESWILIGSPSPRDGGHS